MINCTYDISWRQDYEAIYRVHENNRMLHAGYAAAEFCRLIATFNTCPSTLEWTTASLSTRRAQSSGAAVYILTRLSWVKRKLLNDWSLIALLEDSWRLGLYGQHGGQQLRGQTSLSSLDNQKQMSVYAKARVMAMCGLTSSWWPRCCCCCYRRSNAPYTASRGFELRAMSIIHG